MIYTVHSLIVDMEGTIGHGDIDSAVDEVVEVREREKRRGGWKGEGMISVVL